MRPVLILPLVLGFAGLVSGGCGGSASNLLGITQTPTLTSVPGTAAPGTAITITGTNLNGTSTVVFFTNSLGAIATQSTASSGNTTSISVTVPTTLAAGTYSLYVETTDGQGDYSTPSSQVTIAIT